MTGEIILSTFLRQLLFVGGLGLCMHGTSGAEGRTPQAAATPAVAASLKAIDGRNLLQHIKVLASDEFEGRSPGTKGETLTVAYIKQHFTRLGLTSGNPDGTYAQQVPMRGVTSTPKLAFNAGGKAIPFNFPGDFVAFSPRAERDIRVDDSEVVFVGYGVVAREYGWDDYKGADLRGKTLVMLINDPPVPDPADPSKLDEKMFRGNAMTYYGRWTYKYEIASEKGAAAAIIVHETGTAGYPYEVVAGSWGRENFDIKRPDGNAGRIAVESWVGLDTAKKLLSLAGQDFEALKKSALSRDFKPVPLGVRANFVVRNKLRDVQSRNVLARLEGSDPGRKDEYVIYTAHWDHLGKDEKLQGDQIYNGALDNASGTAALLELAEAFTKLKTPPKRSILFLSLTAEEKGLLGAEYYVENPLYPLGKTVANINMDGINPWGRTRDIVVIGLGNSTLDDVLTEAARLQGRTVKPDAEPEKGSFYRSDHFEFAKQGVPALYPDPGTQYIGKPADYGKQKRDNYTANDYHKPSDEVKPDWDLTGAVDDLRVFFEVGYNVAQG